MKVEKYKKVNKNMYEVFFDNNICMKLYEEVILKTELLLNKNIDDVSLNNIELLNKYYDCYYCALNLIKVSSRTRKEIFDKLSLSDYNKDDINDVINKLESQGYINDERYANSYLNSKIITTNYSPLRIRNDLEKKGITKDIIDNTMLLYDIDIQEDKIKKIINKQIKSNHSKGNAFLKRKIANDLLYQGFDNKMVYNIINDTDFGDDSLIYEKEYNKLKSKLEKKCQGDILEKKIREKLFQKGFHVF